VFSPKDNIALLRAGSATVNNAGDLFFVSLRQKFVLVFCDSGTIIADCAKIGLRRGFTFPPSRIPITPCGCLWTGPARFSGWTTAL
jgi:hypothetical protein